MHREILASLERVFENELGVVRGGLALSAVRAAWVFLDYGATLDERALQCAATLAAGVLEAELSMPNAKARKLALRVIQGGS